MMDNYVGMIFGGPIMWVLGLLLIVLVILLVKAQTGKTSSTDNSEKESPMESLRKRYARGEIDEEEFERRHRELEQ